MSKGGTGVQDPRIRTRLRNRAARANETKRRDIIELMAKRFPPCRCAHCLKDCDTPTSDHVLPRSWYPTTTPENTERWQMPSYEECNQKYGQIESDLRFRLALGTDPAAPQSLGIAQSVHRSLNPSKAKREKDQRARKRQFDKLRDMVIPLSVVQADNILPTFGPVAGTATEDLIPIGIPTAEWEAFGIKLARGSTFVLEGNYIEQDHKVDVLPPMDEGDERAQKIRRAIREHGTCHTLGPGFNVGKGFAFAEKNNASLLTPITLFRFEIWGRVRIYVQILK